MTINILIRFYGKIMFFSEEITNLNTIIVSIGLKKFSRGFSNVQIMNESKDHQKVSGYKGNVNNCIYAHIIIILLKKFKSI
ncbi:hypothetical protein PVAND_007173 [Polypedilum vanderplanki]|uniref:Uncharacterized protein n=1 Tax=Polypedilum vanderplanki TaxID=319348 RepID=A0A9J6C606_POLVA|nr:hypothetical protein PVAND_007173 [Polypedilum vanderplanki]